MSEIFKKNLQRWSLLCPPEGKALEDLDCTRVHIVNNPNGDLNLKTVIEGKTHFFHSEKDVHEEAKKWFSELDLSGVSVLCVYGVGLGYYYYALKEWLKQDNNRFVAFIEDDPEVIYRFLETEMATEIFNDPQVRVFPFYMEPRYVPDLALAYVVNEFKVSSLNFYSQERSETTNRFIASFKEMLQVQRVKLAEHLEFGEVFLSQFFRNIQKLPGEYYGNGLFGKFKGVPAIICGAGPSLARNISMLKQLKDRAIVFAGGTALNALNAYGMQPHFGVGIDPNPAQLVRISSNHGFTVPFFYRNRFNSLGLDAVQGDHLFITGSCGYSIGTWFEDKFDIRGTDVSEGANVINFSLAIAHAMGCDPIICVGVDLAYTNNESYSSGIVSNPIYERKQDFVTKTKEDELVIMNDIYGQPTKTLWKWTLESFWYSDFALTTPDVTMVNATEGGIGFPNVLNISLEKIAGIALQRKFDLDSWIHTEIQNHPIPPLVNREAILKLTEEQLSSLQRCQGYLIEISGECRLGLASLMNEKPFNREKLETFQKKLKEEIAYQHILYDFEESFNSSSLKRLELMISPFTQIEEERKKILTLESERSLSDFLLRGSVITYRVIKDALKMTPPDEVIPQDVTETPQKVSPPSDAKKIESFYEDGRIKSVQFTKEDILNGPSVFYDQQGKVVASSIFENGLREGESQLYYATGQPFAHLRYKQGLLEGLQEYFYVNGNKKTVMHCHQGLLDGKVTLYYPGGQLKRELDFSQDKHHGYDKMWNREGMLIQESEYRHDIPIGIARKWYDNGNLQRLVMYDSTSNAYEIHRWNENGQILKPEFSKKADYFDDVTVQTGALSDSLRGIVEHISLLAPLLNEEVVKAIAGDLQNIRNDMEHLEELNKEIKFESGMHIDNPREAIWKSSSSRKQIKEKVDEVTKSITSQIESIHEIIRKTRKSIPNDE